MEARLLINGEAVRSSSLSEIGYSQNGYILSFKIGSKMYRHFKDPKAKIDSGYYDFNQYLDFVASGSTEVLRNLKAYNFEKLKAQNNDEVIVRQRVISTDFLNVCWYTYKFSHVVGTSYKNGDQLQLPNTKELVADPNSCTHEWISAKNFYNNFINKAIAANDSSYAKLLADIQQTIEHIEQFIFSDLYNNIEFKDYIINQRNLWGDGTTFNFSSKQEYEKLFISLQSFSLYFQSYRKKIGNDSVLVFIYLAAVMRPKALEMLPLNTKMKMLARLAKGDLDNWQILYNPVNDESVVVKVTQSITLLQADAFLLALIDTKKYSVPGYSLFQIFYQGLDSPTGGLGKENKKNFILALYIVWTQSNFNPYKDGIFNQTNQDKFVYNDLVATNPDASNPIYLDLFGIDDKTFNFEAKPITLNYVSKSTAGIYFDNFKFYFSDNAERTDFEYDFRFYNNAGSAPSGKILAVQEDYKNSGKAGLYGTYDYYQPVSLINTNQDAVMQIPVVNGENAADKENINSLVPIFFLKYLDDAGDESDFYTTVGYLVDIASLVAGGYGLIGKLKYLRSLSGFTSAITNGTELGNAVIVRLYVSLASEAIEMTAATLSFLLKLTDDLYKDEPWYKKLKNTLIWIELFSAGGSVLAERMLRNSARGLVDEFNSNPNGWPIQFTNDSRGAMAKQTLEKVGDIAELVASFRTRRLATRTNLRNKFDNLEEAKKSDFFYDFDNASDEVLDELNQNNAELIDYWDEVKHLRPYRKDIEFIKNLKIIKSANKLDVEIFKGRVGKTLKEGVTPPYRNNDYIWEAKGIHHKDAVDPLKGGIGRIVGSKHPIGPENLGYYEAKVEMYNPEFPYNQNSTNTIGWKVKDSKKGISTFFPDAWTKQHLQEELALALKNKVYSHTSNSGIDIFKGTMSDGIDCIIYMDGNTITSMHPSIK